MRRGLRNRRVTKRGLVHIWDVQDGKDLATHAELYRAYAGDVYRFALSLCGNEAEADDVVSETFLRLWTSPAPLRMSTVRAYLIAIARNVFLTGARKRWREQPLEVDVPTSRDLATEVGSRDEWARLRPLLAELPEATRSALIMHAVLGLPYDEIAEALNVPAGALKVRVHRARLTLAEKLRRNSHERSAR